MKFAAALSTIALSTFILAVDGGSIRRNMTKKEEGGKNYSAAAANNKKVFEEATTNSRALHKKTSTTNPDQRRLPSSKVPHGGIHKASSVHVKPTAAAIEPKSFIFCDNGKYDFWAQWSSDQWEDETSFTIVNEWGTTVAYKTFYNCGDFCDFNVCLDYNIWYTLKITDSWSDGLSDGGYFYADAYDDDGTFLDEILHLDTASELAFGSEVSEQFCFGGCGV